MPSFDPRIGCDVEDVRDLRAHFANTAHKLHNRAYYMLGFAALGFAAYFPVYFWHPSNIYRYCILFPLSAIGVILALWSFVWSAKLKCPSCKLRLEILERYCPFCGADGLYQANTIPQISPTMRCDRCEKDYGPFTGVNRKYLIRYCTHCDGFLDNDGV